MRCPSTPSSATVQHGRCIPDASVWYANRCRRLAAVNSSPHHEPRLGGIRSAAASTGKYTVHSARIDWICASEKTTLDTFWMNWCGMERAKRSGRIRQSLAGRPGMVDLEWIGSSHYLYSVSRSASRSLFMLLELETAGRHVCRISGRWSSVLATHGTHASTYTTARLRRMVRATHARACMHAPTAIHRTTQTQTSISNERT